MSFLGLVISLLLASTTVAATSPRLGSAVGLDKRASTAGYADPNENGGGMLTVRTERLSYLRISLCRSSKVPSQPVSVNP